MNVKKVLLLININKKNGKEIKILILNLLH